MTSREKLTIEQLEHYKNTYYKYEGIESSEFDQICDELIELKKENQNLKEVMKNREEGTIELIKAIKILKDNFPIKFLGYNEYGAKPYEIMFNGFITGFDKEPYDLLKEVFESVGGKCE